MTLVSKDDRFADRLAEALRALPRSTAGAGFQSAVLARAESAARRRFTRRRRLFSCVAGACVVAAGLGGWSLEVARERAFRRVALVEEHHRLLQELSDLRELSERRSLILLSGDAPIGLYFDLAAIPAATPDNPAGKRPFTPTRSHG